MPLILLFGVFIYLLTLSSPIVHVWSKKQTEPGACNQEPDGDTRCRDNDLDRFGLSNQCNTLRPVSLLYCIEYEMILRGGPCPPYIVWGLGYKSVRSRSIWLYGQYLQGIRHLSYLNRSFSIFKILLIALRCTPTRAEHHRP